MSKEEQMIENSTVRHLREQQKRHKQREVTKR